MKDTIYDTYRKVIRESKYRWLIILGSLLYILSPIDLLPDIIPVVGWIDDGLVMTLLIAEISQVLMEKVNARKADANEVVTTVDASVKESETIDA
jgi:uncharacterized membrane protein YkvA (DUF1232 family)